MLSSTYAIAFSGIHALRVEIEVQLTNGLPAFSIVGLGDKAIAESRERVRSALHAIGLSLPSNHITVNLAPADLVKEGTHYDLAIAMALIGAMEIIPADRLRSFVMMGELGLDGTLRPVSGILPASVAAYRQELGFICPASQGAEALWSGNTSILAPKNLLELINHFKGYQQLSPPIATPPSEATPLLDFQDIKGHETAKRALEIAAAGGHNVLMIGPPGSGKSMLASRFPSILPKLSSSEILEVSQIHSIAGLLQDGHLITTRPYRAPHHSASMPAMVGGGLKAQPGEVSLAHHGVLFLDELPEFKRQTLEALRQPLESGVISIARANAHITYPARFQLIAAMNPCRCGYLGVPGHECARAPKCAQEYQSKISGPLLDRVDIQIDVPLVAPWELAELSGKETSSTIRSRVEKAVLYGQERLKDRQEKAVQNAFLDSRLLEQTAPMSDDAKTFLVTSAQKLMLSGRGYHRVIRLARTIADLEYQDVIQKYHIAEALSFRRPAYGHED